MTVPGKRAAADQPGRAPPAARSGEQSLAGRVSWAAGPLRSAEGGTGRKRNGYFFLMRALVTFEDRRPRAGSRRRAETRVLLSAVEDPGETQSWGVGDAVAWTR